MNKLSEKVRCPLKGTQFELKGKNYLNKITKFIKPNKFFQIGFLCIILIFLFNCRINNIDRAETRLENLVIEEEVKKNTEKVVKEEIIKDSEEPVKKSYEEIATEIIRGNYGTGVERVENLKNLGYSIKEIKEIQGIVDKKCPTPKSTLSSSNGFSAAKTKNSDVKTKKTSVKTSNDKKEYEIETNSTAQTVWNCLKKYGWNNIVCAGIMGNIMAEVGGQTFNLVYNASGGCGYGLCQWTSGRRQLLLSLYGENPTIEEQVEYIYKELTGEGVRRQVTNSGYNSIINASSPEECALAFAHAFERCGAAFQQRQINARKAYEVFS